MTNQNNTLELEIPSRVVLFAPCRNGYHLHGHATFNANNNMVVSTIASLPMLSMTYSRYLSWNEYYYLFGSDFFLPRCKKCQQEVRSLRYPDTSGEK